MSPPVRELWWRKNPLASFVTRMQQWDYRLGINGVKRMQGGLQQRPGRAGRVLGLLARATFALSAAGRTRSARTSSSPGR